MKRHSGWIECNLPVMCSSAHCTVASHLQKVPKEDGAIASSSVEPQRRVYATWSGPPGTGDSGVHYMMTVMYILNHVC